MESEPSYKAYSEGLEEDKLIGSKCEECERIIAPPRGLCPHCGAKNLEKIELTSKGKIDIFTIIYVAPPQLKDKAPYAVAIVKLKEGPRVMGRLLDVDLKKPEKIEPGTEVEYRVIEENEEKVLAFTPTS